MCTFVAIMHTDEFCTGFSLNKGSEANLALVPPNHHSIPPLNGNRHTLGNRPQGIVCENEQCARARVRVHKLPHVGIHWGTSDLMCAVELGQQLV